MEPLYGLFILEHQKGFNSDTANPRARDADMRFYALALLGCRELWKIRTPYVECYGTPYDPSTALEYALGNVEPQEGSRMNLAVLALAYHFNGDNEKAIESIKRAIDLVHPRDPTRMNYMEWMSRFEAASN